MAGTRKRVWPPTTPVLDYQIMLRSVILLMDMFGIGMCFGAAARMPVGPASSWVAGSFMCVSIILVPVLLMWTVRLRTRVQEYDRENEKKDTDSVDSLVFGCRMLQFCLMVDITAFVGYSIAYGFQVKDVADSVAWYPWGGVLMLGAYASVTVVISLVLHGILVLMQAFQLYHARKNQPKSILACGHCGHSLQPIYVRTAAGTSAGTFANARVYDVEQNFSDAVSTEYSRSSISADTLAPSCCEHEFICPAKKAALAAGDSSSSLYSHASEANEKSERESLLER